jgi:hypothetical protein
LGLAPCDGKIYTYIVAQGCLLMKNKPLPPAEWEQPPEFEPEPLYLPLEPPPPPERREEEQPSPRVIIIRIA